MKRPNLLIRLGVLASSIILLAGFIGYRAGAFDRFVTKSAAPAAAPETPVDAATPDPTMMSGSKYIVLPAAPANGGTPTTIMPGSKSVTPLIPLAKPDGQAAPAPQSGPTVLPGSKSDRVFTPPAGTPAPTPRK
jgi:hypothetical protein